MSEIKQKYYVMEQDDAKQWMDAMKPDEFILLDVRMKEEFDTGHIKGAISIPDYAILKEMKEKLPDKNKPIFIYCRSGVRSKRAAQALASAGYKKVYEFGGIIDWKYGTVCNP